MKKIIKKIKSVLFSLKIAGIPFIIGFLGSYAGSYGTSLLWRRAGIASIVTLSVYITSGMNSEIGWIWALVHLSCMSLWGAMSCGYGVPDSTDEGSTIGRFWYKLFKGNHKLTDYFTRSTIALMKIFALISIPIMKENWICYGIGGAGIILTNALISWRGLGSFKQKIFGKEVEFQWSDIINYTLEGCFYYMIIFWKFLS